MSSTDLKYRNAADAVDALDAYLDARAEYDAAKAQCEENHGVVIYDVIHKEQDAKDDARARLYYALRAVQG
jgi:hypothetical protein